MTDDLVFTNERDPSLTPPKEKKLLPVAMQPGDPGLVDTLMNARVTVRRGPGWPGTAKSTMKGPRGIEVYVRLDQGTGAWFPLDELGPADETLVATVNHIQLAADVARNAEETVVLAFQRTPDGFQRVPTVAQLAESERFLAEMDFS